MKFLFISASGRITPTPIDITTLDDLLSRIGYIELGNELIISKRSLVDKAHDRIQDDNECPYVLCVFDDFLDK